MKVAIKETRKKKARTATAAAVFARRTLI